MKAVKGTLYIKTDVLGNIISIEARNIRIRIRPCGQYKKAVDVVFTPKGARKPRQTILAFRPLHLVVVEGWGHPDAKGGANPDDLLSKLNILADYRQHDPCVRGSIWVL